MPALKNPSIQNTEITLAFSSSEFAQLEAFAALHGESVVAFIQNAALKAARITSTEKSAGEGTNNPVALWLTDDLGDLGDAPKLEVEEAPDLFAPVEAVEKPKNIEIASCASAPALAKKGVAGEPSTLAKGHGLVWETRRALGRERVHGLGWTREQLAFVLKLSVVGVRKMEHLGTVPVKSLESRKSLLNLAKTLENPDVEIAAYIKAEEAALS